MVKLFLNLCPRVLTVIGILLLIAGIDIIVYSSGGTGFALTHLMYLPILIMAFVFGIPGGIWAGLTAGIALGSFMPLDVLKGIPQTTSSWMFRLVFFVLTGALNGFLFRMIRLDRDKKIKESQTHYLTGYPNQNKLRRDLRHMITTGGNCTLVILKIINLGYINRYVDDQIEEEAIFYVIKHILDCFERDSLYCITRNEYVLAFPDRDVQDILLKMEQLLAIFDEPVLIAGMPIDLIIKGGIANHPLHSSEPDDLLVKLERTLDQDKYDGNKISVYQNAIAEKNKANYELIIALYDALKNNEFYIVYQPKIDMKNSCVKGLEALLRWEHPTRGHISPEEFIQLAEYIGIINDITKWVVKNVIDQLKTWNEEGLPTKVAVNISSRDLRDDSLIEFTKEYLAYCQVDPAQLEFELTERTIVENENSAMQLLHEIQDQGLTISLDDFGTGYNSLIHLVKLPIDYVKLDKFFIHSMSDTCNRPLIMGVINIVHTLGMSIIAEGVETEEQAEILRRMGCDMIQGYYYSRPLPPIEIKEYILRFNA